MTNHGEDTFTMGLTSVYDLNNSEEDTSVMKRMPVDDITDTEDPFVMGRTLLVFAVVEFIIGLGIYRYIS